MSNEPIFLQTLAFSFDKGSLFFNVVYFCRAETTHRGSSRRTDAKLLQAVRVPSVRQEVHDEEVIEAARPPHSRIQGGGQSLRLPGGSAIKLFTAISFAFP